MSGLVENLSAIAIQYGPWGVFLVSFLEEVIAPIPSTLTVMASAFVILSPYQDVFSASLYGLLLIAIPTSLGMVIGGLIIYALAYFGGKLIIDRWGKWLGISWEAIEKTQKHFNSGYSDEVVLMTLRAIPMFPNSLISGVCGFLHYPIRSFIIFSFIGGIPRAFLLAMIGWWAENTYRTYADIFSNIENYIIGSFILLAIGGLLFFLIRKKKA